MKRKWFFVILILVVTAIVLAVVFVNLFRDKNTKQLSNALYDIVDTGYLNSENEENKALKDYLKKLNTVQVNSTQYLEAFEAFEIYADFLNREMPFVKYSLYYKQHRKEALEEFSDAKKAATNLKNYLDSHKNAQETTFWLNQTWQDCEDYVEDIIFDTAEAIENLCRIYQAGAVSSLHANDFTEAIFIATENNVEALEELQVTKAGTNLLTMARAYLVKEKEEAILNYQYNDALKEKVAVILEQNGLQSAEYTALENGQILN